MSVQNRTTLKSYFNTGDFPTEGQFSDLIDSYRHATEDAIEIADITGLTAALASATVADGDKGDITVSAGGTVWSLDPTGVTPATYGRVAVDAAGRVVDGSNADDVATATISAAGETSMFVRYTGAAPVLTKNSDGNYQLTVATGARLLSLRWSADPGGATTPATYTGGAVNLLIRDTDGALLYGVYEVISKTTGQDARNIPGVLPAQTTPTAGDVNLNVPNVASITGGFIIIGVLS